MIGLDVPRQGHLLSGQFVRAMDNYGSLLFAEHLYPHLGREFSYSTDFDVDGALPQSIAIGAHSWQQAECGIWHLRLDRSQQASTIGRREFVGSDDSEFPSGQRPSLILDRRRQNCARPLHHFARFFDHRRCPRRRNQLSPGPDEQRIPGRFAKSSECMTHGRRAEIQHLRRRLDTTCFRECVERIEKIQIGSLHIVHVLASIIALVEFDCAIKDLRMNTDPTRMTMARRRTVIRGGTAAVVLGTTGACLALAQAAPSKVTAVPGANPDDVYSPQTHGLPLPAGIVQPFDMRFESDELHVIAYFQGHPEYEAVEAMIHRKGSPSTLVRAILTRHDQTQIDHVNDRTAYIEARAFEGRETVHREVDVHQEGSSERPCITVRFTSFANEAILLRVVAASAPDAARGGLTDPGRHSPTSSLPLMWRGKSCLAGPGTTVLINEKAYEVAERVRSPQGFTALNGFYTEMHQMGAMRASTRAFDLLHEPSQIVLGSSWIYSGIDRQETRYVVTDMHQSGQIVIENKSGRQAERIWAVAQGRHLRLLKVERRGRDATVPGFVLRLLADGHFAMDIANNQGIVSGLASAKKASGADEIELLPQEPSWATARKARVRIRRVEKSIEIRTTVG